MKTTIHVMTLVVSILATLSGSTLAQDWPQWRGPNRDAKAIGFEAPETWPKELTQKWKVAVGDGVSTPALVGNKLFVIARQEGNEVIRCLNAATGDELWQETYEAAAVTGPAGSFSGPRCSPIVADGKVVTLGVQGTLSCLDAETGSVLWRNTEFEGSVPQFSTASSPIVVDGLCVTQLGGDRDGAIVAFDLATGNERWRWTGDGPAYGSPVLMNVDGTNAIITPTDKNMVAVDVVDGKLLWQISYSQGRYNAATPIVDGQTLIYAGPTRGTTAEKFVKQGDVLAAEELWSNPDNSVQFVTPLLREGLLFGLSTLNTLFCIDTQYGQTTWNAPIGAGSAGAARQDAPRERQNPGGRRGGRGGRGNRIYGSVVDAGSVLLALTGAQLIVFEPNGKEFQQITSYKVADSDIRAYPIVVGNRVYVKDQDSVTLWAIE